MKELIKEDLKFAYKDFNKIDIIEIDDNELIKILKWSEDNCNKIKNMINEIKLPFQEFIIKLKCDDKFNELFYYKFKNNFENAVFFQNEKFEKEAVGMLIFKYDNDNFETIRNGFFNYGKTDHKVMATSEFRALNKEYDDNSFWNNLINLTEDDRILSLKSLFDTLAYITFNQESIIKETKTHTKKANTKKAKRTGKKAKTKLIKQTIIRLNTDHIPTLTEEEKRQYERHTLGWTVRGHWRTYQDGKKVWIKPQIRGDKDNVQGKVYEV